MKQLNFLLFFVLFFMKIFSQEDSLVVKLIKENYPNGQIKSTTYYLNDKKNGIEVFYFEDGSINSIVNYENDLKNGFSVTYIDPYSFDKLREYFLIFNYKKGKADGESVISYFEDNIKKIKRGFYTDNKKNGYWYFYENNNLTRIENYSNGELLFEKDFKP